ncbi:putative tyrosine-protein kinase [Apostichopus japonicus]|uniref:Putative tyrosine-protein kinase n=1 Tax=Stichopus japonicus TaxID=307972 RepID=A0A2G8LK73_STIJA|nr:putative tyrosine-protein kinase [Apostichopus japonicus]
MMVMLDLSAAFDTVDHDILLSVLDQNFGTKGLAKSWFDCYLRPRTQSVQVGECISTKSTVHQGVPQGSCAGPVLFTAYASTLYHTISSHLPEVMGYADDHAQNLKFKPGARQHAIEKLQLCIAEIQEWMTCNKLKLNESKTEFIVLGSPYFLQKLPPVLLKIGYAHIEPTQSVRNLGIMFDANMTMTKQISSLCQSTHFQLRNIRRIKRYLDKETLRHVVRALVISRLDYGNLLLFGATEHELDRVQRLQNNAARLVCSISKRDHITPTL